MIGTRTPFRVSFVGGGSDLKEFYSRHPGCVVSTTINYYMYIFLHPYFNQKTQVKYSVTELVDDVSQLRHPLVREALKKFKISGVDINSIADIPAGTGLASSSTFTVGLLHALYAYISKYPSKERLAKEACELEIDILKEPIGKQDQYAAAYGGLNCITFYPNDSVNVEPIILSPEKYRQLEENTLLFYFGGSRSAKEVLNDQRTNIVSDKTKFDSLVRMSNLALALKESLNNGDLNSMGEILDENWQLKKSLSTKISDDRIDYYYTLARKNGAIGGKLLGAGGCGFMIFYCEKEHQEKLRHALKDLREMKFTMDSFGTKIIFVDEPV